MRESSYSSSCKVDAAGRSAAQATPKDTVGEGAVGMTLAWRLDKQARTVLAVANPSAKEAIDFEAVLYFGGRTYTWNGERSLRPGEARHIDIRRLRDEQIPDQAGELLPADVTSGQTKVFTRNTPKRVDKLIGQALQVEADGSLAGFLSCPVCPPDDSSASLSPLSLSGDVGGSKPIKAWLHGTDGSKSLVINPLAVAWDVGNEKVATVSGSNFQVKFQGPGKTAIGATINGCRYVLSQPDPADDAAPVECNCRLVRLTAAKKADVCVPQVEVQSASLPADRITVKLSPANKTGVLTVQVRNTSTGSTHTVSSTKKSGGTHHLSFGIKRLPNGKFFNEVRAVWTACSTTAEGKRTYQFKVLGDYRHSQYNVPNENGCSASTTRNVTILNDHVTCFNNTTATTLRDGFADQVSRNGSGHSISYGYLKPLAATRCNNASNKPAGANNNNTYVKVSSITGSCNTALDDSSVAACARASDLPCGTSVFTGGVNKTKTVRDSCPDCCKVPKMWQLDNFNASRADCEPGAIGDLGTGLKTIKLGSF